MKKKKDKTKSIIKGTITKNIEALLISFDMNPLRLAQKTGIHNETIYRCLNGIRKWNLGHLQKIAPVLGVTVGDLVQEAIMVPMVGRVKEGQGPPQAQILRPTDQGWRSLRFKEDKKTLSKTYNLEVDDRSMMPSFPPGTILTAQRDTADIIKNENFVVYWCEDGQTYIRQIFLDQDHIVLRSLTQGVPDKILPASQLALCNKILQVEFPA